MEDAREARRKRLAERKTDRLAFITGQSRSPALSAPQAVPSREKITLSETPELYHNEDIVSNALDSSNKQEPALKFDIIRTQQDEIESEDSQEPAFKFDAIRSHQHEIESEDSQVTANHVSSGQKYEVSSSVHNRTSEGEDISGKLFTTSMLQKPASHDAPGAANDAPKMCPTIFTSREISHSVLATETLRLFITLVLSFLVISSNKGLKFGSTLLSGIASFRPLLLVFLTDVMIILGSAFLNQGVNHKHAKDAKKAINAEEGWPNDLSRIFEIGQMLHKILSAAFMDCCICAVIVICGIAV